MLTLKELFTPSVFHLDGRFKVSSSLPNSLSEMYHENTKMHPSDVRPWLLPILPTGLTAMSGKTFFERSANSYKKYDGYPTVQLAQYIQDETPNSLWGAISHRRSRRQYSDAPIHGEALSTILHYGYGETGNFQGGGNHVRLRAVPSAGALYPLDIYPLVNNVSGMANGLYHYNVQDHSLECLRSGDYLHDVHTMVQPSNNEWLTSAGTILFVTATFKRNQLKYGDRGYRGILLDAGHLSQNILLSSTALGYSACTIVACLDDPVNDFLGIDGVEESILFAISIGSPEAEKTGHEE